MEAGAVKQAYNNEVILMKKKLNQAKIQIIHKLTRKAKTLTEKNAPEKLKAKFTKKAESAVKEVLIIKKIKARDVAKFIVTHKGQLSEYLNRPTVDQDKACARLLLHKALQDIYKVIRERFFNISIKDLLMSRQERIKLKKEAKEKQKNKKKGKDSNKPVQAEGHWDVEEVDMDDSQLKPSDKDEASSTDENDQPSDFEVYESENDESDKDGIFIPRGSLKNNENSRVDDCSDIEPSKSNDETGLDDESTKSNGLETYDDMSDESDFSSENENAGKFVKTAPILPADSNNVRKKEALQKVIKLKEINLKNQTVKKHKENIKNENFKNKILLKKLNKEKSEIPQESKVVDPFFITETGDNYISIAEPRLPDEVKEVHKQGNRKYRRAVMFGLEPKVKPRRDNFRPDSNNTKFGKFDGNNSKSSFSSNGFVKNSSQKNIDKTFGSSNELKLKDRRNNDKSVQIDLKPEKLHPSWEAKKRQSGILPFQGKKIVFDES